MKKMLLSSICICILLIACKENELELPIVKAYTKAKTITALKEKDTDKIHFISGVKNIFSIGVDSLIVIPEKEKTIYVTNNNLEILQVHNFNNIEYMINPPIMGTAFYNKEVYFLDIMFTLKKYNIKTRKITNLQIANRGNNYLDVYNDSTVVATEASPECPTYVMINQKPIKDDNKILIGIKSKGRDMMGSPLYCDRTVYGSTDYIKYEVAYANIFKDKIYFIFRLSKKVLIYNTKGEFIKSESLQVNDDFYKAPTEEYSNGRKGVLFSELTSQPLKEDKGYLTHLYRVDKGSDPCIVCYNEDMKAIHKYLIKDSGRGADTYIRFYWLCNDRLYTTNGMNGITIYE